MDKTKKLLEKLSRELLAQMGFNEVEIKAAADAGVIQLTLSLAEQEAGALIGYHGETIAALQLLLGLMYFQEKGEWVKLTVDVGDYRKRRTEYLTSLAKDTAVKVAESGEPLALYNLNPFERRTVHLALAENKSVITESQGEGKNRFLVVSPAAPQAN